MKRERWLYLSLYVALVLVVLPALPVLSQSASTVQAPYVGIWISASELEQLPVSGTEWTKVLAAANATGIGSPNLKDQDSNHDQYILAKALVYARTGIARYREEVITALKVLPETENGGRTLALGRNLAAYVIAADLVNLPLSDPTYNATFKNWLGAVRRETLDGRTLVSTHEGRPNNWGLMAGASLAAAAVYLDDEAALARVAQVFQGYLGDRTVYNSFSYGALDWQCDPAKPLGINPDGCSVQGVNVGGAQPEEMRRAGAFANPPTKTGYAWEALQGTLVQAYILHRAEYPAFEWSNRAILRAVLYLKRIGWAAESDDAWQPYLINFIYGPVLDVNAAAADHGKNMGWTSWTHGVRSGPVLNLPGTVTATVPPTSTSTPTATQTATIATAATSTDLPQETNTPIPTETVGPTETVEPTVAPEQPEEICFRVILTDPPTVYPMSCN
jgi:hypothetical protein